MCWLWPRHLWCDSPSQGVQNDRTWDIDLPAGTQEAEFGGGGVRLFAGVWKGSRTELSFSIESMSAASKRTILKDIVIPTRNKHKVRLLHDGDGSHTAKCNQALPKTAE